MNAFLEGIISIALAIVGLAALSVLVSRNANTTGVIQSAGAAFGNSLGVAEAPVTGTSLNLSLGYPAANSLSSAFGF